MNESAQLSLEFLFAAISAQQQRGIPADRDKWVDEYPEFAAHIKDYFRLQDLFLGSRSREPIEETQNLQFDSIAAETQAHWNLSENDVALLREMVFDDEPASVLPEDSPISEGPEARNQLKDSLDAMEESSHPKAIGPYRLVSKIADGGMGTVWIADQLFPVKRRVAMKLIRDELNDPVILARFEAEQQSLARMGHPNIASIFDAGTTDSGRPFLVMEHVQGLPITDYCRQHKLSLRDTLQLFTHVCHAIEHAHQKGIIHRDLKPANILIAEQENKPLVKIVDFGIAKFEAKNGSELLHSAITEYGQVLGTIQYMSPEQAGLQNTDIDTRTDVYSLGVVLYQLLTGQLPIDLKRRGGSLVEALQSIQNSVVRPPSARVIEGTHSEGSDAPSADISFHKPWRRELERDLDWVVMKALEKERQQRYASPFALAEDIERFLSGAPVVARPPSRAYLLSKFVRKNRGAVVASAAILVVMLVGLLGTLLGLGRAIQERNTAQSNLDRALAAEKIAEKRSSDLDKMIKFQSQRLEAISIADMATSIESDLISQLESPPQSSVQPESSTTPSSTDSFKSVLKGANFVDLSKRILTKVLFDPSVKAANEEFQEQPELAYALLSSTAQTELKLGLYPAAVESASSALTIALKTFGSESEKTLTAQSDLGLMLAYAGRKKEALELTTQSLEAFRKRLGNGHPDTLRAMNNLAGLLLEQGDTLGAEELFVESLQGRKAALGVSHPDTLMTLNNLGGIMLARNDWHRAMSYFEDALEAMRRTLGPEHPDSLMASNNVAFVKRKLGKSKEAEELFRDGLEICRRSLGKVHPLTLHFELNLGAVYCDLGELEMARPLYEEVYETRKDVLGEDHPDTIIALNNLAYLHRQRADVEQAITMQRKCFDLAREVFGLDHPNTLTFAENLCMDLQKNGSVQDVLNFLGEIQAALESSGASDKVKQAFDALRARYSDPK